MDLLANTWHLTAHRLHPLCRHSHLLYFEVMILLTKTDKNSTSYLSVDHYQIKDHRFFFGMWLTVILRSFSNGTPLRGLNKFTCRPTLIFFVRAPSGKMAWTWGTTVLDTMPPSGPMACTSCRIRDTTAKYCGKSWVTIRVMRPEAMSSIWLRSWMKNDG